MTVKRSVQRNTPPTAVVPFASGVVAATVADRPWDCLCEWAPRFVGSPGEGFRVVGFRLKFGSRFCPHAAHRAGLA